MARRRTYRYEFDTWAEFIDRVQQPTTWVDLSSRDEEASSFNGNCTWDEALHMAQYGWQEGRENLANAVAIARPERAIVASVTRDVAGDYPLIPAAVAGDPMSMIARRRSHVAARPVIRIDYNISVGARTSSTSILNRGAALLSTVDALETRGYSCELRIFVKAYMTKNRLEWVATYKRAGEPLDMDRAAFALTHPSVLRRMHFALTEQHKKLEHEFRGHYGKPDKTPWDDEPASVFVDGATADDDTPQNAMERMETLFASYME